MWSIKNWSSTRVCGYFQVGNSLAKLVFPSASVVGPCHLIPILIATSPFICSFRGEFHSRAITYSKQTLPVMNNHCHRDIQRRLGAVTSTTLNLSILNSNGTRRTIETAPEVLHSGTPSRQKSLTENSTNIYLTRDPIVAGGLSFMRSCLMLDPSTLSTPSLDIQRFMHGETCCCLTGEFLSTSNGHLKTHPRFWIDFIYFHGVNHSSFTRTASHAVML